MTFAEFVKICQTYPLIRSNIFPLLSNNAGVLRRQVSEWVKKKWLFELKRSMYIIANPSSRCQVSNLFLANYLSSPSYVSLETALSHYRLIPERIEAITSITSKKTQRYQNALGYFIYRHVKQSCYTFFIVEKDEFDREYYIATPEKALIDYLYFHTSHIPHVSADYFSESLRLQNTERLSIEKLFSAARCFDQKKLSTTLNTLITYIKESV